MNFLDVIELNDNIKSLEELLDELKLEIEEEIEIRPLDNSIDNFFPNIELR